MKKIIISFCLLFLLPLVAVFGQQKVAEKVNSLKKSGATFEAYQLLTPDNSLATAETKEVVKNATYAKVDQQAIATIFNEAAANIRLEIPYQNELLEITLYKVKVFAEDFHLDSDKKENIPYAGGVYYRGIVEGETTSVASFSFFQDEFNGIMSSGRLGNLVLGKLQAARNKTDYIIYQDENLLADLGGVCQTDDATYVPMEDNGAQNKLLDTNTTNCVTFYFEIDYDLYVQNGSDETNTANWMSSVYNNVQTLYENDGITTALKSLYIWTTNDPYSGESSSDYLYQFNEVRPIFDGDLGMLVGIDPGGLGGVAVTIGGFCSQNNFSYSDVNLGYSGVPTYSWTVQVITHEFGHLMGSPHTHACAWNGNSTSIDGCGQQAGYGEGSCATGPIPYTEKGTIMSYCHLIGGVGISFSNGFGTQPRTLITNTVEGSNCLSTDCVNTCINMVESIALSNITDTSFDVSWIDNSETTSWQVSVAPVTSVFDIYTTVTSTSYSVANLNPNTYYKVSVRPDCSAGGQSITPLRTVGATTGDVCAVISFTDTGGINANYGNDQHLIRTFTPDQDDAAVTVTFTNFALEQDYDIMYIYDGPSTASTLLTPGGLTGNTLPGTFTSSSPEGSLTFEFVSDSYITDQGWEATISCTEVAATDDFSLVDFSYYPNPTKGVVTLNAKNTIEKIKVYNVTGQLLLEQTPQLAETVVDISKFDTGTYFFTVEIDGKSTNFKVLKY